MPAVLRLLSGDMVRVDGEPADVQQQVAHALTQGQPFLPVEVLAEWSDALAWSGAGSGWVDAGDGSRRQWVRSDHVSRVGPAE